MTISALIDKTDNFELIRDQIAAILATETTSQQALATAAGEDPDDWKFRVFKERANPWEQFLDEDADVSPIVNVWFDNMNADGQSGNVVDRQKMTGVFNLDIIAFGKSANDESGGHVAGDKAAALNLHRTIRLVRNIIMSADYTYLELRGTVWKRWVQSISTYQPQLDGRHVQQIIGARFSLQVTFNETSPQVDESNLIEYISATVYNKDTGEVYFDADYDYTEE